MAQAALDTFRADAAQLVTDLDNNKDVSSEQILASYAEGGLAGPALTGTLPWLCYATTPVVAAV